MSLVQISKRKDTVFHYNEDGFAKEEVLVGAFSEARFFRCSLKPGRSVSPELFSTVEHTQVFLFMEGNGYVVTPRKGFNIDEHFAVLCLIMIRSLLKSSARKTVRSRWNIFISLQN